MGKKGKKAKKQQTTKKNKKNTSSNVVDNDNTDGTASLTKSFSQLCSEFSFDALDAGNSENRKEQIANIVGNTSSSSNPPELMTPPDGWAREVLQAKKKFKGNKNNDEDNLNDLFRLARAYRVMRQWDKLKKLLTTDVLQSLSSSTTASSSADDNKNENMQNVELMIRWKAEAMKILKKRSNIGSSQMMECFKRVYEGRLDVDRIRSEQESFSNLNALQCAAMKGDIQVVEKLVALGAAIDYNEDWEPDATMNSPDKVRKPAGSTALLLAVTCFFSTKDILRFQPNNVTWQQSLTNYLEVSIQLIRLGADCSVKLIAPPEDYNSMIYQGYRHQRLIGKTVKEIVMMTGCEELIDTIKQFDTTEKQIELVNCRCGSRLPWKDCHYSKTNDSPYCTNCKGDSEKVKLMWRYSPEARCPCDITEKTHFRCCWQETFRIAYQDDITGDLSSQCTLPMNESMKESLPVMKAMMESGALKGITTNETRRRACSFLRSASSNDFVQKLAKDFHPKSKIGDWDNNIVAGIVENIDNYFFWLDVHWKLPKPELLLRTKEWNEALEKYCNDAGLTGSEREEVIIKYTGSPLAPCASMNCDKVEQKVKEFKRCSRCASVGYCSVKCQREDWKFHKKHCMAADAGGPMG